MKVRIILYGWSWKSIEAMYKLVEIGGNQYGSSWKSMEPVEVYMVVCGSWRKNIEASGSGAKSVEVAGSMSKLVEVLEVGRHFVEDLLKLLDVYEARGGRWNYIGDLEARGSFHRIWSWKLH